MSVLAQWNTQWLGGLNINNWKPARARTLCTWGRISFGSFLNVLLSLYLPLSNYHQIENDKFVGLVKYVLVLHFVILRAFIVRYRVYNHFGICDSDKLRDDKLMTHWKRSVKIACLFLLVSKHNLKRILRDHYFWFFN